MSVGLGGILTCRVGRVVRRQEGPPWQQQGEDSPGRFWGCSLFQRLVGQPALSGPGAFEETGALSPVPLLPGLHGPPSFPAGLSLTCSR